MLDRLVKILSSPKSLLALSVVLLLAFAGLFFVDADVKRSADRLHTLTVNAERILNADRASTAGVRLAAALETDRYILNYQDIQDTKYALLKENLALIESDEVRQSLRKMEEVQADIEDAEAEAIAFIDEENWEEALELVTEPAFRRQKGIYRSNLSTALRDMIQASQVQSERSSQIAQFTQYGVLGTFMLLALIGFLYSREMRASLIRQSELAANLEDANENLEQRVSDRTAELEESRALFKTVLDNMPAAVFLKDMKGYFQLINSRYEEVYGVPADGVSGKTLYDLMNKMQADELAALDLQVISSGAIRESEHTLQIDGAETVMASVMFPIKNRRGDMTGIGGVEIDITERNNAEREVAKKEAQLRAALDTMSDGIYVLDSDLNFTLFNDRYLELVELPAGSVALGQSVEKAVRSHAERGDYGEGEIDELVSVRLRRLANEKSVQAEMLIDGGRRVITLHKEPMSGGGAVVVLSDITERKAAEREVAEKEAQLRAALDNMSDGIYVLDADLNFTLFNDRYLELVDLPPGTIERGKSVESALRAGMGMRDLGGQSPEDYVSSRLESLASPQPVESEMLVDGGRRVISLRKTSMDGGGAVVVLTDITERKQAEEELAHEKAVLDVTLETMDQGISMFDEDLRLMTFNSKFLELLELPATVMKPGVSIEAAFRYNAERGEYAGEDTEEAVAKRMELSRTFEPHHFERTRPDGVTLEIRGNPLQNKKGFVTTYTDITERKQAEEDLRQAYDVISSSISYASRIQRSILPDEGLIGAVLSDHFIMWEPRDIVGGDIYWAGAWGDGFLLVLGDCTGHGVPGAFMTLISMGAMERARAEVPSGEVGKLLSRTHQFVQVTLSQHYAGGESDDGIELGACYFVPDEPQMTYAGARFDLFVADGDDVQVIKGTNKGAGYRGIPYDQVYADNVIELKSSQRFYLSTDGLIDQVGGEKRRAYGKKRLKRLIIDIKERPFAEQKSEIENALADYQGEENRRDDISVIGFKI